MTGYPDEPLTHVLAIAPGADLTADPATYTWQDIAGDIQFAETIDTKRGSGDEQQQGSTEFGCVLRNSTHARVPGATNGRYTTDNPESDLWPYFDLGLPLRHSIDLGDGAGPVQRSVTYLASAVDEWPGGTPFKAQTRITGAGLFQRLGQGDPLRSPIARAMVAGGPIAFWALEDPDGSTAALSSLKTGGSSMLARGSVDFAATEGPAGAAGAQLPTLTGGGQLIGTVNGCSDTGWRVEWVANTAATEGAFPIAWSTPAGSAVSWRMIPPNVSDPNVYLQARLPDTTLANNAFDALAVADYQGQWHHFALVAYQNGAQVTALFYMDGELIGGSTPGTSYTLGAITEVTLNALFPTSVSTAGTSITGSVAYVAVYNSTGAPTSHAALDAYTGELAHIRWGRLCDEEGVPSSVTATTSTAMGPQGMARLLDQLREIEATDMGLADDSQGVAALRCQNELFNQAAQLTIDAAGRQLFMPFAPTRDDQKILNRVTASSTAGQSATVQDATSIARHGAYDGQITVNVADAAQLPDAAGWRVWLGIQSGKRYPAVTIDFLVASGLAADWLGLSAGDLIVITNPPLQHAKGDVRLLATGWSEQWGPGRRKWRAVANCVPASPYDVGILDDVILGRLATGGAATAADLSSVGLSVQFNNTDGALWTIAGGDFPMDVWLGGQSSGELATLSGVSGASNPQTATISARSVNGVSRSWPAGTAMQAYKAMVLAR